MSTRLVKKTAAAEVRWLELIDAHLNAAASEPSWLRGRREKAREVLASRGFPTTRDEDWKYTDPAPLANIVLSEIGPRQNESCRKAQIEPLLFDATTCCRLVFLDGEYSEELSCICEAPPGVVLRSLKDVLRNEPQLVENHLGRAVSDEDNAFVALNTALFEDGAFVQIPNESIGDKPIQILFVSTGKVLAAQPRVIVLAGGSCEATIVESYVSLHENAHLTNAVTEIFAGPNARVDHYKSQTENENALHVATMQVLAARDANIASHAFTFGGRVARSDANAIMQGEGCEVTLNGLYLGRGEQLIDNHTIMDHAMPHCRSYELYTGILDDASRGVFNGKIFVREDAQKTDAKQSNRALLLSRGAEIDTKPQLEIFADDVKCTHGATVGQLDENALFYLRSRGVPERQARDILIGAFAGEILNNVRVEPLRAQIEKELFARLKPQS
jgi:Fe-S cluster assembly protein SufD